MPLFVAGVVVVVMAFVGVIVAVVEAVRAAASVAVVVAVVDSSLCPLLQLLKQKKLEIFVRIFSLQNIDVTNDLAEVAGLAKQVT